MNLTHKEARLMAAEFLTAFIPDEHKSKMKASHKMIKGGFWSRLIYDNNMYVNDDLEVVLREDENER